MDYIIKIFNLILEKHKNFFTCIENIENDTALILDIATNINLQGKMILTKGG